MDALAALAGVFLLLWGTTRLLGALARLVEAAILGLAAVWLLTGRIPSGPEDLREAGVRVLILLEDLAWRISVVASGGQLGGGR